MREKKKPIRRCIGCMTSYPKADVVRIVAADGRLTFDKTGRLNGRGAYLCPKMECFDTAVKKKRFAYALGISMTPEETVLLKEEYAKILFDAEVN